MVEEQLPDVVTDSFEKAGLPPEGPAKVSCDKWSYQKPKEGSKGSGAYRGSFTITEKPGQAGLKIPCSESFFTDGGSLWKLRDLAMANGINYGDKEVNWRQVAMECIGKSCWVNIEHQKGKDQRVYARFTSFAPSLAKLQTGDSKASAQATGGVRL